MPVGKGLSIALGMDCRVLSGTTKHYQLFIIGGGINGCGLARDAAGRGLSVCLAEQGDLASATSSASTKLIHGGLRYLEMYEFRLVREALQERDVLLHIAPHLVRPLRFVLPHHKGLRPRWLLRAGLFVYDHLGGGTYFPHAKSVDLSGTAGQGLKDVYRHGFEYSDARVDDARLVIANARSAKANSADIKVRCRVQSAIPKNDQWLIELEDQRTRESSYVSADFIANMGGPWAREVIQAVLRQQAPEHLRLVQGSHIIVPRLSSSPQAFIFQNQDGRIVFTIPYQDHYSLIGTTDRDYKGDPSKVRISAEEVDYLCASVSEYFAKPVSASDVVWSYSGVRPLYDDGAGSAQATTRDYVLKLEMPPGCPPYLTAFGGKITTYRHLAEAAMEKIEQCLGQSEPEWTHARSLPGGDFSPADYEMMEKTYLEDYSWLGEATARRLFAAYGTEFTKFCREGQMGEHFGHGFYEAELNWLRQEEWAQTAEDVLWRRSKLGLYFDAAQTARLEAFLASQ